MSVPVRLAVFAALLMVLGLAGYGIGSVTGPIGLSGGEQHTREHTQERS